MKISTVLPYAALSTAFVLPPQEVLEQIAVEENHRGSVATWYENTVSSTDDVLSSFKKHFDEVTDTVAKSSKSALDHAFEVASDKTAGLKAQAYDAAFDAQSWLESSADDVYDAFEDHHHGPPHDGPPHDGPPHDGPPHHGPPHHGPPHHEHGPPNKTVYELIASSKYTTKLAKLISEYDDLVEALNSTSANFTVFAPTDKAFEKIPEHAPKPTKEQLKAVLEYHVVPGLYPAFRVLATHTVPTLLNSSHLGKEPLPQRLAFKLGLNGLTVNFYSRIIAVNIFGTNGVIHGVDSIIIPPPSVIKIISLLPTEFSTLELGLAKTGLLEKLNTTDHAGGTFFAPSNFAFQKLGAKVNAFLFSTYGQKYLKALLEYHVVPDNTLYSDAYYKASAEKEDVPKGYFHVDLPTLLEDRKLAVDIARYGGYIS